MPPENCNRECVCRVCTCTATGVTGVSLQAPDAANRRARKGRSVKDYRTSRTRTAQLSAAWCQSLEQASQGQPLVQASQRQQGLSIIRHGMPRGTATSPRLPSPKSF